MNRSINRNRIRISTVILTMLALAGIGTAVFFYYENRKLAEQTPAGQIKAVEDIRNKIAKLIELPTGEPILATVDDVSKLGDQKFFEKAQNGDYLLIFSEAKLAYLYRESTNKLINVGPIEIQADNSTSPDGTSVK